MDNSSNSQYQNDQQDNLILKKLYLHKYSIENKKSNLVGVLIIVVMIFSSLFDLTE